MEKITSSNVENPTNLRVPDHIAKKQIEKEIDFDKLQSKLNKKSVFLLDRDLYFNEEDLFLKALARLIYELKPNIEEYDTILSDDASGRLVSLLIRKIANEARKFLDKKPIKAFFIASGRRFDDYNKEQLGWQEREMAVKKFLIENSHKFGKTLVVTEQIVEGQSIEILAPLLQDAGIKFDVAAASVAETAFRHGVDYFLREKFNSQLYYGEVGNHAAVAQYNTPEAMGVTKKSSMGAHPIRATYNWGITKTTREDLSVIAKEFKKLL